MADDLDRALADWGYRETVYVEGGPLADFLVRVGGYAHHPIDDTDYHDQKSVGFPRITRSKIQADRSMPFAEYVHLLGRDATARALALRHPSTPKEVLLAFARSPVDDDRLAVASRRDLDDEVRAALRMPRRLLSDLAPAFATAPVQMEHRPSPPVRVEPRPAPPPIEERVLRHAFEDPTALESFAEDRSPVGDLLRRVGAFTLAYATEEDFHDWNGALVGHGIGEVLREAIPLDPSLPFGDFERLLAHGPLARRLVARHPSTPDDVVVALAQDEDEDVQVATGSRVAALPWLAQSKHEEARYAAARHPAADASILGTLAFDPSVVVRVAVAIREDLPAEIFARLLERRQQLSALALNAGATDAQLAALAVHPEAQLGLAKNRRTPADVLRAIAEPGRPGDLQVALAGHPNTPEDVISMLLAGGYEEAARHIAARKELDPRLSLMLAEHRSTRVRLVLAKRSDLAAEVRTRLSADPDAAVRKALAGSAP